VVVEHCLREVGMWEAGFDAEEWGEWAQEVGELAPFVESFEEQQRVGVGALDACWVRDFGDFIGHVVAGMGERKFCFWFCRQIEIINDEG